MTEVDLAVCNFEPRLSPDRTAVDFFRQTRSPEPGFRRVADRTGCGKRVKGAEEWINNNKMQ
jgi:hypothetical protein